MEACAIAIARQKGRVLWVKRRDLGIWVLPGGGIDKGEEPEKAALRELFEEAGIDAAIERKAATLFPCNSLAAETHLFFCSVKEGVHLPKESEEASAIAFFPLQNPPKPHFPLHQEWLVEAAMSNGYFERRIEELNVSKILRFFLRSPLLTFRYAWRRFFLKV